MARTTSRREPLRYQVKADKREADAAPGRLYIARALEIQDLLDKLRLGMVDHAERAAQNPNHYGYAGDLAHVADILKQAVRFMSNEEA